jgi:hypothetical protein
MDRFGLGLWQLLDLELVGLGLKKTSQIRVRVFDSWLVCSKNCQIFEVILWFKID